MSQRRLPHPPTELGSADGLAYALFMPDRSPRGGVVILHGADSCKESHFDFARAARGAGLAAVAFDQRGHGDSAGALAGRAVEDVATIAGLLPAGPLALRGSSLGGYLALVAADELRARAVVAICPAGAEQLLRTLRTGAHEFAVDRDELQRFLELHDLTSVVERLDGALLLLHAEGDEQVPVAHSVELYRCAPGPAKRLLVVPGGHHRSIQHDAELTSESVRFIVRRLAG